MVVARTDAPAMRSAFGERQKPSGHCGLTSILTEPRAREVTPVGSLDNLGEMA
jgi:hypothetical protein